MARASAPRRTVLKGTLDFLSPDAGVAISIPIFVYKKGQDLKKVEAHLYHVDDHGKIFYKKFCAECQDEIPESDIEKLVETGNGRVPVEAEEVSGAYNKTGTSIRATHTIPMAAISEGMIDNTIMPKDVYQIRAFRTDSKKAPIATHENMLASLFESLRLNKQALIVSAYVDTVQRQAIILPTGDMWTLCYEEEIREDVPFVHEITFDKEMVKGWRSFLKSRETVIDSLVTAEEMQDKMDKILSKKIPARIAVADEKKEYPVIDFQNKLKATLAEMTKKSKASR